jgi:glycosyltransferase involved in cell wall biosynthesis
MALSTLSTPSSPPRISVITVVKNGKEFVGQTLESVLAQNYANLEYIVIDGASTDGTVDVIRAHGAKIAKWVSERDDGIADAFNKGFSYSTGDYLLFLNADDALANPDVIDSIARQIVGLELPMLLYGDCDVLDRQTGKVLYRASIDIPGEELLLGKMIPQPSLFAHRSYFEKYGVFDRNFRVAMDYEWLLRGGLAERMVHVPSLVTNVRGGGISTRDQKRVVNEIIAALKKNGHMTSLGAELQLRGYYLLRTCAKALLDGIGLYGAYSRSRIKRLQG